MAGSEGVGTSEGLPPPLDGASGRYIAERELGRGSSGITYLCRRVSDGAPFVLKELRLSMIEEWKSLDLFEREVATLRSLDHPGIPAYVDAVLDREQGRFALVQEYIDGRTLDEVAKASESLSLGEFRAYLRGALEVLAYLHARLPPVVHRDIKPRNLMIRDGRLFLIDFGAVRLAFTESTTTTSVGTFGYMAPEQIRGRAEPASDLFSLGMTFICLATRRQPENLPVDPESGQIDPRGLLSLPTELSELLLAMIEPGLRNRLGSATEALARLDPQAVTTIEPPAAPRQPRRRGSSLRRPAVVLGVLVSLVLTGGYVASRIPAEGELRTLGGWFSGHGSTFAAIQETLLGDSYGIHSLWIRALAFSPDGALLASSAGDGIILWRVDDGAILARQDDDAMLQLRFSSDGESLVGAQSSGRIHFYDPETAELQRVLNAASIASDDFGRGSFRIVDLWAGAGPAVRVAGFVEPPYDPPESPRPKGAPSEYRMVVVDPVAGKVLASTELPAWRNFNAGALSDDGERVALAGNLSTEDPDPEHPLVVMEIATGRLLLSTSTPRDIRGVSFNENGSELLTLDYDGLYRWDLDKGERVGNLGSFDTYYDAVITMSPASERVALAGDDGSAIVDLRTGNRLAHYDESSWRIQGLAFSPDGSILASGGSDQLIKLWKVP